MQKAIADDCLTHSGQQPITRTRWAYSRVLSCAFPSLASSAEHRVQHA